MTVSPFDLTGRRAVVTGGGRGLGRGITEGLIAAGADVVILQRSGLPSDLREFAESAGRSVIAVEIDLSDAGSVERAATTVLDSHPIDILVNNAGAQFRAPAIEFPMDRFDELIEVNLRSAFRLCQLFGAPMLARQSGKIINVASLLSFQGGLTVPAYAASKGGIAQLTKALCNEWAGQGVNVNAIAPGYMATDLNEALIADPVRSRQISERIPAGRWGSPADVGSAAVFLSSVASDYVNGIVLPVDGGWLAR